MKKLLIILLPLFFVNCTNSNSGTPIMEIVGIYIAGDEEEINYADHFSKMPNLNVGDKIDILFALEGNGDYLQSFVVKNENTGIKTVMYFIGDEISPELSDLDLGRAIFVDGVSETGVTVQVKILAPLTEEKPLLFSLNSKSPGSKSATVEVTFKANTPSEEIEN